MNPWQLIPYQDYEKHMSHPDVKQLQCLNTIIQYKTELYGPASVAVYGCCTGNGFEHFTKVRSAYGIDINSEYLAICANRHSYLGDRLTCIHADIDHEELNIPAGSVDLIFCHLFLEYVDLQKAIVSMSHILSPKGNINIVIQNNANVGFVSDTGVTSLNSLSPIANKITEADLLKHPQLTLTKSEGYNMPNGKTLQSFDFVLKR